MNDLVISLGRLGFNEPQTRVESSVVQYNDPQILGIQKAQLRDARLEVRSDWLSQILPEIEAFCELYELGQYALENFVALATGNPDFPVILLQNPTENHEYVCFEEVVTSCRTLTWLEDVLKASGLSLGDVIILDVCPLLSDEWIKVNPPDVVHSAIEAAYAITEKVLLLLKPKLLISCQCATKGTSKLSEYAPPLMEKLGSSVSAAQKGNVVRLQHRSHIFHVVQAYHPRFFLGRYDYNIAEREECLQEIISHFLKPFGQWKTEVTFLSQMDKAMSALITVIKLEQKLTEGMMHALDKLATAIEKGNIKIKTTA